MLDFHKTIKALKVLCSRMKWSDNKNIILLVCEKNIQEGASLRRGNPTKCLLQSFGAQRWVLLSRAVTIVKEMSFKCDLEFWKILDLEIPYMFHVKMEKELGWQKFWLHRCSKKSFWSAWYWPIEFTTSVLYLSCLQFCYWNNYEKKLWLYWDHKCQVNLLHDPWGERWFWGFHFVNGWRLTLKWAVTHSKLSILQNVKGKDICIHLSDSFGQEAPSP